MAFQVSPGVQVKELDRTNIIPAVSTSIGAFAGHFNWGPVSEIQMISSEQELANIFGTPTNSTFESFFTASSFLKYGNALKVVRSDASASLNASNNGVGVKIKNMGDYDASVIASNYIGRYPGALGNSISIEICPVSTNNSVFNGWANASLFDIAPGTSIYAAGKSGTNDEIHIVVIDTNGEFTGTQGSILEIYKNVSLASDATKDDGTSNFYKTIIRNTSKYIWQGTHDLVAFDGVAAPGSKASTGNFIPLVPAISSYVLSAGIDSPSATVGEILIALDMFSDAETEELNLLFSITDLTTTSVIAEKLIAIASTRKDCLALVSPPLTDSQGATPITPIKIWADLLTSSSYFAADSSSILIFDKYNNTNRFIPASGYIAGLCAHTDNIADPWVSPAGFNRGQLLGIVKLAWNPKKADRDALYKSRVNSLVTFPGQGTVLYGDKTGLSRPSAFDRINVRRLFIVLEKSISIASKFQLFENNTDVTRATFRNMVEPFLREIKGRGGVTDFFVVADTSNNTGEVIDSNRFVGDIYIKPVRSINFISLNFVATRTDVQFSEVVGTV